MATWRIRATMEEIDVGRRYAGHPTIFSILLNHGGEFTKYPGRNYINGKQNYVDLLDIDTFSVHDVDDMMDEFGHVEEGIPLYYHFKRPNGDLDFGLFALGCDDDIRHLGTYVAKHKLIEVYIEHGTTTLHTYTMSPSQPKLRIQEIVVPPSCSRRLLLCDAPHVDNVDNMDKDNGEDNTEKDGEDNGDKNLGNNMDKDNGEDNMEKDGEDNGDKNLGNNMESDGEDEWDKNSGNDSDDGSDSNDSDFFVDENNILEDVYVDMNDFNLNVDKDAEWVGGEKNTGVEDGNEVGEVEVLDNEILLSGSSSDEGPVNQRKKCIKSIRRAHQNDDALVGEPFYLFQTFSSAKAFKQKVYLHAIETRREIEFEKNDKNRVRVVCTGSIPTLGNFDKSGPSEQQKSKCPWVLYASKWKKDVDWMVKTYNKEHRCLQTRKVKACNYKFLAKDIINQVETNPNIPVRALLEQLQRKHQLELSSMKVFRAKSAAIALVRGDYAAQYNLLRDYVLELQTRIPESTVKIDVESEPIPSSESRTFKRIYICLGPLKKGFVAGRRDLLGLDGSFIKGPFPGQILTAVGLDGNSGTYPLAYAIVESENTDSWSWFLSCLGDDLHLHSNSNFTFITDRQKGVIPAIAKLFPCAEHRFCLRHIHENMKLSWRGKEFKEILWKCATSYTIQQFTSAMEELRKLNNDAYEWLKKIPPHHWSRSHFTGRAKCDVLLNNMCESFNSQILRARDKPIITCLEYIREYLMKKIVNVQVKIEKATGPLTPTATATLEKLKTEATELRAVFCGNGKYQVAGHWVDQYVVDMRQEICSCKKWEVTGMPCKHAIAAIWEMRKNNEDVRIPESWVHRAYWLQTWREMYSFTIDPINGRNMWEKSACPTSLLPPKYRVPIGRPKKKRRKSALERDDLVKGNKVSRACKTVTCSKCHTGGHNARSCKGQNVGGSSNVGGASVKKKGVGAVRRGKEGASVPDKGKM